MLSKLGPTARRRNIEREERSFDEVAQERRRRLRESNAFSGFRSFPSSLLFGRPFKVRNHSNVWLVLQCRAELPAPMLVKNRLPPMMRAQLRDQNRDDLLRSFLVH